MGKRVVVDPITRIEGHLRAEVVVNDEGVVKSLCKFDTMAWT